MAISSANVQQRQQNPFTNALKMAADVVNQMKALDLEKDRIRSEQDRVQAEKDQNYATQLFDMAGKLADEIGPGGAQIVAQRLRDPMINALTGLGADPNDLNRAFDAMAEGGIVLNRQSDLFDYLGSAYVRGDATMEQAIADMKGKFAAEAAAMRSQTAGAGSGFSETGSRETETPPIGRDSSGQPQRAPQTAPTTPTDSGSATGGGVQPPPEVTPQSPQDISNLQERLRNLTNDRVSQAAQDPTKAVGEPNSDPNAGPLTIPGTGVIDPAEVIAANEDLFTRTGDPVTNLVPGLGDSPLGRRVMGGQ